MHTKSPPEFKYKASVVKVIDGDTIDAMVDLGFCIYKEIRIRVRDINAPEIRGEGKEETTRGLAAKALAESLLPVGREIQIDTYKLPAIYNRYEADITLPDGRDFATVMRDNGFDKSHNETKTNP